jgi:hypothetical protein
VGKFAADKLSMKIQPISNNTPAVPAARVNPEPPPQLPVHADIIVHGRLAGLNDALDAVPSIRPGAVALGRSLAADPHYPGPIVLDQLAGLFVADAIASSK